jgi:hypothetical protein
VTIPIEFEVKGKPSSVNGTSAKKLAWQTSVSDAGKAALAAKYPPPQPAPAAHTGNTTIKVFFFPHNRQYLDIDNGLKHTIDALRVPAPSVAAKQPHAPILADDRTIFRLITERFPPRPGASLVVPAGFAPTLARALMVANGRSGNASSATSQPEFATAIKFESYADDEGALW